MSKQLSKSKYNELLGSIEAIYHSAQMVSEKLLNQLKVQAYWKIGERIVTVEQKNQLRAAYGEKLLERLSKDLTKRCGSGFSKTNLGCMRQFYRAFPIKQPAGELDWTKRCLLLTIEDKRVREKYEKVVVSRNLSRSELADLLKRDRVKYLEPQDFFKLDKRQARKTQVSLGIPQLSVTKGVVGTYRLIRTTSGELKVDCGFSVYKRMSAQLLSLFKDKDIVEILPDGKTFNVLKVPNSSRRLYTFSAILERVVDGDTMICEIDCGLKISIRQRLRLRGINCDELKDPQGDAAKKFVQSKIKQRTRIIIKTHLVDKYDRPLVDVWFGEGELYLNQLLLDQRLARIWE